MLITVLLWVLLIVGSYADDIVCNNSSDSRLTFLPSNDGVEGRYNVEWCTETRKEVTHWELTLRYNEDRPPERCEGDTITYSGPKHSYFKKDVKVDLNCTNVCFSTSLDLIFNGTCYLIKTLLHYGRRSTSPEDHLFYIKNDFPKTHFTTSETRVLTRSYNDEHLTATWYLSYVPASEYSMLLCAVDNSTGQEYCQSVTHNCSVVGARRTELWCAARAPFRRYDMRLRHLAPWDAAELFRRIANTNHFFDHKPEVSRVQEAGGGAVWWGAALAAALALAVAAALALLCRRKPPPPLPEVLKPEGGKEEVRGGAGGAGGGGGGREGILLVYARDCAPVMRAADLLKRLLQRATDQPVVDLHSSSSTRVMAGAAGEWVRRALARRDLRTVLLQTPAAKLHTPAPAPPHAACQPMEQPLLGRRVVYRVPGAGDALVALALRLLAETAHAAPDHAYRRCYKTRITGLDVDVAPTITPFRWYSLPEDVLVLLRDLDPDLFPPDHNPIDEQFKEEITEFNRAIQDLISYVNDNPNYLNDEVFFI